METKSRIGVLAALLCASAITPVAAQDKAVPDGVMSHKFAWGDFKLAPRIADKLKTGKPVNIVIQVAGTGVPISGAQFKFGTVKGCEDAKAAGLNANCRLVGPVNPDPAQQINELETLLNSDQVDCLGVQAPLPNQFNAIINRYVDAGVPAMTLNNDAAKSKRFSFSALNEVAAGRFNGEATAKLVREMRLTITEVALGSGGPDEPWAQGRMQGFQEGFKASYPDVKFFNDYKTGLPTSRNYTTAEVIDSVTPFLTGNPKVNLFFHTDQGVEGVARVINNLGLTGKSFTSGFNVSGAILDDIEAGRTLVTIDQGFDNQSEAAVKQCVAYLTKGDVHADPLQYLNPIVITKAGGDGMITVEAAKARLKAALGK
ncbi:MULTISPECIES: sugar ABC transporter substrate-binding protein [Rhizobium/Agrobacterium group]|uniref:Sugar ABC transporter (Sugar-binding protein) n=2 Tax=Rhizobium/Agrobacterium group TaxID=227290 RepID=B9K3J2_ALLAM|nr:MULTISPECIES: substrate-binding domain-containing protein [Rhizobium/Agrobacterium group]ACM39440.1 sugar ABC transporter (sugar-binding protein) [Allorhizobium ampelinum S4]MCF1449038.1 sugar ABC transporter substrate-binding protein [Allorhizobium ampelinum]MUO31241.1 substrate-binding domain-containing protein [Agrobacterium vitis]MUO44930.1 substrate-binding domain-containing protein [Agrobacterium vitis]MUP12947.1 substrate-binding domain-containing protein [Agrobacterium vitis]